jgi:hypothetical protein
VSKEKTQFKAGNQGKPKGAENKTTKAAKELFVQIMEGQVDNIQESLERIREKDPGKYLEVLSKFFPYFIPKKMEIDTPEGFNIKITRKVVKA